jgi:hypothetical protein
VHILEGNFCFKLAERDVLEQIDTKKLLGVPLKVRSTVKVELIGLDKGQGERVH